MIAAFCERIGYTSLELLVSHFQGRVLHGVKDDLVDLTHLKGVRGSTARLLYTAGLETVECIAESSRDDIHAALCQGKRSTEQQGEWKKAGMILKSAIQLLQVRSTHHSLAVGPCSAVVAFVSWDTSTVESAPKITKEETIGMFLCRRELMQPRTPSMKRPSCLTATSTKSKSLALLWHSKHIAPNRHAQGRKAPPMGRQLHSSLRRAPCLVL